MRRKKTLRCVFFATFEETWKYDGVYQLMEKHERFDPIILVCPIVNYGYDNMIRRMDQCYSFFKEKGYTVLKGFDISSRTFCDVRQDLKPDIILLDNDFYPLICDFGFEIQSISKLFDVSCGTSIFMS